MSRCSVCNVVLSDQELKHKDPLSGRYTDMCSHCLDTHEALVNDVDIDAYVLHTSNRQSFNGLTSDDLLDSDSDTLYNDTLE